MTDFIDNTLEHSWGKSPKQKAREKEYNHEYYLKNKDKWLDNRPKARQKTTTNDGSGVNRRSNVPYQNYEKWLADNNGYLYKKYRKELDDLKKELIDGRISLDRYDDIEAKIRQDMRDIYNKNKNVQAQGAKAAAETERTRSLVKKKQYYLSELEKSKDTRSAGKKARDFVDGVVWEAMDNLTKGSKATSNLLKKGSSFISDFLGITK